MIIHCNPTLIIHKPDSDLVFTHNQKTVTYLQGPMSYPDLCVKGVKLRSCNAFVV